MRCSIFPWHAQVCILCALVIILYFFQHLSLTTMTRSSKCTIVMFKSILAYEMMCVDTSLVITVYVWFWWWLAIVHVAVVLLEKDIYVGIQLEHAMSLSSLGLILSEPYHLQMLTTFEVEVIPPWWWSLTGPTAQHHGQRNMKFHVQRAYNYYELPEGCTHTLWVCIYKGACYNVQWDYLINSVYIHSAVHQLKSRGEKKVWGLPFILGTLLIFFCLFLASISVEGTACDTHN